MTYIQLTNINRLLMANPNIGKLSNKSKIDVIRIKKLINDEVKVYEDLQKEILKKYDLVGTDSELQKFQEEKPDKFKEFNNELDEASKIEPSISIQKLSEDDFFLLVSEKEIKQVNKDGQTVTTDYCLSLSEIEFLSNYLLA